MSNGKSPAIGRFEGQVGTCCNNGAALTFREKTHFTPKNKREWRMRASIPLPLTCKASALPFELIPLRR